MGTFIIGLLRQYGGWIAIGALVLAYVLWHHAGDVVREEQLVALSDRVEDQIRAIEGYRVEIAELESYRYIEQGLRAIIAEQSTAYTTLERKHGDLKRQLQSDIGGLSDTDRDAGQAIVQVWEYYEGVVQ